MHNHRSVNRHMYMYMCMYMYKAGALKVPFCAQFCRSIAHVRVHELLKHTHNVIYTCVCLLPKVEPPPKYSM